MITGHYQPIPKGISMQYAVVLLVSLLITAASAQTPYKLPPTEVVDILDMPPFPLVSMSPARDAMMLVEYEAYPPIELLARPIRKLAGIRIDPQLGATQRTLRYTGIGIQGLPDGAKRRVELPAGVRIGFPSWSPDGTRFAFTREIADGVELWIGETASGKAWAVPELRLNDVLGGECNWLRDNRSLLVTAVPKGHGGAPAAPSSGRRAP